MPFTDPMADGPAIQAANIRSLAAGTTTADILSIADGFRARHPDVPLVLMGYANPMLRRGADWFAAAARDAGVDGVICVDVPPEEDDALGPALRAAGIAPIRLATPTTDAARLPAVLDGASGFLYYVSVAGITGLQQAAQASIDDAVARLKAATDLPVAVGFGIRTPEQAAADRARRRRRRRRLGDRRSRRAARRGCARARRAPISAPSPTPIASARKNLA